MGGVSHHGLGLPFSNQVRHNLALVLTDVHQILFCPSIFINGSQDLLWVSSKLLNVGSRVHKVQELNFATIVKEDCSFLRCVRLLLVELRHAVQTISVLDSLNAFAAWLFLLRLVWQCSRITSSRTPISASKQINR